VREAGERFRQRAEAGLRAERAGLPEPGDAHVDEPGILAPKILRAELPRLHAARTEVLDHHIGGRREPACDIAIALLVEVERNHLLVARDHLPPDRHAVLAETPATRVVTPRMLHLDHVGAEITEVRRDERCRVETREVEHTNAAQRQYAAAVRAFPRLRESAACALGNRIVDEAAADVNRGHALSFAFVERLDDLAIARELLAARREHLGDHR